MFESSEPLGLMRMVCLVMASVIAQSWRAPGAGESMGYVLTGVPEPLPVCQGELVSLLQLRVLDLLPIINNHKKRAFVALFGALYWMPAYAQVRS